jgi:hypothetical protein
MYYIDKIAINIYIKSSIKAKFKTFIKLFSLYILKKKTAYKVKSIALYLLFFLELDYYSLFLASSILKMLFLLR